MLSMHRGAVAVTLLVFGLGLKADAQQAPSIGYLFPPGGSAGSTVDVVLGGYDWTPDMELFVRDSRIQLELTGEPGPVIVPEPPYWFGKKARRPPFMLPRETPARLKLPADIAPGIYRWQAANANGASASGKFVVSDRLEVVENRNRQEPQLLPSLPVTVAGQILKIEEVDEFRFTAVASGPMSCDIVAAAIDSPLTAIVEIRDSSGRLIADVADTAARDACFTFAVEAGQEYFVRVYDVDFRGNRSFVYRLSLTPGPRLVATIPAAVQRGTPQDVEFVGYGLVSGSAKLGSVTDSLLITTAADTANFSSNVALKDGQSVSYRIPVSDLLELTESSAPAELVAPVAVTGVLDERYGVDRFRIAGTKGDVWDIDLQASAIGSPLDVSLTVLKDDGTELKRIDDVPGTTDARIEFTVPADGSYDLLVSDASGASGSRQSIYRLVINRSKPDFQLTVPELLPLPVGGTAVLSIHAERKGGFTGPIAITVAGLPDGASVPEDAAIPEKKNDLKLTITAAADAGAVARMVTVTGTAVIDEVTTIRSPEPTLLAMTLKPPFTITAEGRDDVTKWPRGTTFPAPVLIEREETFKGDIILEMSARQGRHRQGIRGPEFTIRPDENRILYPVFLPEWLETTRTSRMVVNGVAQIADPKGRLRYSSSKLVTRIGFLPTGAMLKIESPTPVIELTSVERFEFPVTILRAAELSGAVTLELFDDSQSGGAFHAEQLIVDEKTEHAVLKVEHSGDSDVRRLINLKARATGQWNGHPVVAATTLTVVPVAVPGQKVAMP